MNEHRIHQILQVSVLPKGAHALIECVGSVVLALVNSKHDNRSRLIVVGLLKK